MSCFQIVSLPSSLTTQDFWAWNKFQLWVAFKLYLYRVLWQPFITKTSFLVCCELLSNCIFTEFSDNHNIFFKLLLIVVSCFQIVSLPSSLTTTGEILPLASGCELLSNCIFTEFSDNSYRFFAELFMVVSCFQIVSLPSSLTTRAYEGSFADLLWVAFKLYLYRVLWQRPHLQRRLHQRCELLSNCIFTEFSDNRKAN